MFCVVNLKPVSLKIGVLSRGYSKMKSKKLEVDYILSYGELKAIVSDYKKLKGIFVMEYQGLKSGRGIYNISYGEGRKKLISVCGLHGNEGSAVQFWHKSLDQLIKEGMPNNTKYSIITPANPDGFTKKYRYNNNETDLNRDWDDFSQLETRIIKEIIDKESKSCRTIVFDHHECHDQPLYFLEDPASEHMTKVRNMFFIELYKELKKHKLEITEYGFFYEYTNAHTAQAARSGQLINYTAQNKMFSLIVENMGQYMGNKYLEKRMQAHASVDLAGLRTLNKLK